MTFDIIVMYTALYRNVPQSLVNECRSDKNTAKINDYYLQVATYRSVPGKCLLPGKCPCMSSIGSHQKF